MNPHYQNLLDDRNESIKIIQGDDQNVIRLRVFQFLTSRRLIEWKKEVERLEEKKKDETISHRRGERYILSAQATFNSFYNNSIKEEIALLQEAIALTEAEK